MTYATLPGMEGVVGFNQINKDLNNPIELARLIQSESSVQGLVKPLLNFQKHLMEQYALKDLDFTLLGFRISTKTRNKMHLFEETFEVTESDLVGLATYIRDQARMPLATAVRLWLKAKFGVEHG